MQLAKEGLDIKPLNRLFLIAPTKNSNVLIQAVGRIERKDTNKQTYQWFARTRAVLSL